MAISIQYPNDQPKKPDIEVSLNLDRDFAGDGDDRVILTINGISVMGICDDGEIHRIFLVPEAKSILMTAGIKTWPGSQYIHIQ